MSLQIPLKPSIPPLDCFQYTSNYTIIATLYTENLHEFWSHWTIVKHNYLHYSHRMSWEKKQNQKNLNPKVKLDFWGRQKGALLAWQLFSKYCWRVQREDVLLGFLSAATLALMLQSVSVCTCLTKQRELSVGTYNSHCKGARSQISNLWLLIMPCKKTGLLSLGRWENTHCISL